MPTLKPRWLVCLFFARLFSIGAIGQTSPEPAKLQTPQDFLQAMAGKKLIFLQFGDADKTKLRKNDLNKVKISCDLVVQIKEASQHKDTVTIAWAQIGTPSLWGKNIPRACRDNMSHDNGVLVITGFAPDETADSLAASLSKILQTPEQYLATAGIIFDLPAEPDIPGRVTFARDLPKALLSVDPAFSEEARKSKYMGTLAVTCYVGTDGRVHRPTIPHPLGMGLDQQALNVLPLWRFRPARKLDQPVAAMMNIEISFNLY
jgi:Gram-negative bacterial TonB protein C-terminal